MYESPDKKKSHPSVRHETALRCQALFPQLRHESDRAAVHEFRFQPIQGLRQGLEDLAGVGGLLPDRWVSTTSAKRATLICLQVCVA